MINRRCIFCGRLTEIDRAALFRMPADRAFKNDAIYADYLLSRGITDGNTRLPDICGMASPEFSRLMWEKEKPVLITKTGRSSDTLICPSCHNELFRNTDDESVNTAVFFGAKESGKTSLIASLANTCITEQFSPDEQYRYFFNDRIYPAQTMTDTARSIGSGTRPDDLREPVAVFRTASAKSGGDTVCDVMHDTSSYDMTDELTITTAMPFAAEAKHFIYCIPADKLAEAVVEPDAMNDMRIRLDMYRMMCAFGYASPPPKLDVTVTKLDLAETGKGAVSDLMMIRDDPKTLRNYVFTAYPSIEELSAFFTGIEIHAVSALNGAPELYAAIFG